ncbi:MAG: formylglycine-generating enzyme family protein, partial [Alphaproteobacteria bacterium]
LEWVEDCKHETYKDALIDGSAWTSGGDCSKRVLRGGSWYNVPRLLRSAFRYRFNTSRRGLSNGFRIARTLSQ